MTLKVKREKASEGEKERQRKVMNAKMCVEETARCPMVPAIQNEARARDEV